MLFQLSPAWELMFLMASGTFVTYNLRVCFSVAVLGMRDELNLSESQKGYLLSSFYWGKYEQFPVRTLTSYSFLLPVQDMQRDSFHQGGSLKDTERNISWVVVFSFRRF